MSFLLITCPKKPCKLWDIRLNVLVKKQEKSEQAQRKTGSIAFPLRKVQKYPDGCDVSSAHTANWNWFVINWYLSPLKAVSCLYFLNLNPHALSPWEKTSQSSYLNDISHVRSCVLVNTRPVPCLLKHREWGQLSQQYGWGRFSWLEQHIKLKLAFIAALLKQSRWQSGTAKDERSPLRPHKVTNQYKWYL